MRIMGKRKFVGRQLCEKPEAPGTIIADSIAVNQFRAAPQIAQVVPVKLPALFELCHQPHGVKCVLRLTLAGETEADSAGLLSANH